jgi:hypothetical protein
MADTVEKLYDKNIIVRRSLSIYFFNAELGDIQKMKVFLAQKIIDIEPTHSRQSFSTVSAQSELKDYGFCKLITMNVKKYLGGIMRGVSLR